MNLIWTGEVFDCKDMNGNIQAFNIRDRESGSYLFVSREEFLRSIESAGYLPFWAVLSERSCYSSKADRSIVKKWAITQRVYGVEKMQLKCYQDKNYDIPLNS